MSVPWSSEWILAHWTWSRWCYFSVWMKIHRKSDLFMGRLAVGSECVLSTWLTFGNPIPMLGCLTQAWCRERSLSLPQLDVSWFVDSHGKLALSEWRWRWSVGGGRKEVGECNMRACSLGFLAHPVPPAI